MLLTMEELLPWGYAIICESSYFTDVITTIGKDMRWECHKEDTDNGSDMQKILICQKKLWYSSNQGSRRQIMELKLCNW